ncbi:MAG: tetratricopeptide repeat protein [Endomicrobium sp.]|jgi:tetratricopeptide (TPR) repeat protein|nr:tetratricopeptide repeat protein [Endomicrobium sp.]
MQILSAIKKYKTQLFFFCLFAVIAALYSQSLKYDYTYIDDDVLVLHNYDFISDYKNIPKFFLKSAFYSGSGSFYRPVLTLSFAIDAMIAGKNPFMYHLSGILLHIASVFLLFIFLRKLEFNETLSFLFTMLFALHPAFAHAVAWIPGRNDLLLSVFTLLSLIFLFDYYKNEKKDILKMVLSIFLFAIAVFTKESAVVMIAVMPAFMFLFCKNVSKKDYITVFISAFLICCVYMALRSFVLTGGMMHGAAFSIVKALKSFLIYCEYMITPHRIYLFPEKIDLNFFTFFGCLIFFAPLAASLFFNIGRKRIVLFGAFWFLAFLVPSFMASNYVISLLPHRLYAASAGFIIMFIEFFSSAAQKIKPAKKYIIFMLAVITVLFAFASYAQVKKFQNKYVYLSYALNEQPQSQILRLLMAQYYADNGKYEEAKREIFGIKSNDGTYSVQYYEILGYVYSLEGSYERATEIFDKLLEMFPGHESSLNNLSQIYFLKGEYDKALVYSEMLIAIRPEHSAYRKQYAKIRAKIEKD